MAVVEKSQENSKLRQKKWEKFFWKNRVQDFQSEATGHEASTHLKPSNGEEGIPDLQGREEVNFP